MPDTREGVRGYIGPHAFVAELAGELIGYTLGKLEPVSTLAALPVDEPHLEVVDLYVSPTFRCRGIGGLLIETLLDSAKAIGVANFRLMSATKDIQRAISFYERYGFRVVSVDMVSRGGV